MYKDVGSYPLYKIKDKKYNAISPFVFDLAKTIGEVSLNYVALEKIKKHGRIIGYETVFNEITWINPNVSIEKNISSKLSYGINCNKWVDAFIDELKNWFIKNLSFEKEYWLLHSSGGDSRILSGVLSQLRKEGYDWNIKFVSWYPEARTSYKILKFLGWENERIWLVGRPNDKNNYWNENNFYDFDEIGIITNGEIMPFGSAQSNFWKPYFVDVSNITIIMALMGDVVMGALPWWRRMKRYHVLTQPFLYSKNFKINTLIAGTTRWNGLGILGYLRNFEDILIPTMSYEFVSLGINVPFLCRFDDQIRKKIQEKLKKGLSTIPNDNGVWVINNMQLFDKIWEDYYSSIFYKETKLDEKADLNNKISYPVYLSLASLVERLINEGTIIKFR